MINRAFRLRPVAEARRIKDDEQLPSPRRSAVTIIGAQGLAAEHFADQRPGQKFNHGGERRPFMSAERQLRAGQSDRRISCWPTLFVHRPAQGNAFSIALPQLNLASRDLACGKVEDEWRLPAPGPGKGHGIGAENRGSPAMLGDAADAVAEREGDEAGGCKRLKLGPQRGEMIAIRDGQRRNAKAAGAFGDVVAGHLMGQGREPSGCIEMDDDRRQFTDDGPRIARHLAAENRLQIAGKPKQPMRLAIVPFAGRNVSRDRRGLIARRTGLDKALRHQSFNVAQRRGQLFIHCRGLFRLREVLAGNWITHMTNN